MAKGKKRAARAASKRTPAIEWASAAIGLFIVIAMFGLLVVEAIRGQADEPPRLIVTPVRLVSDGGSYFLEVDVTNNSPQTGAGVQIEGELKSGEEAVETSSATLSYVPGLSKRRAGLVFSRNPRDFTVELRATGYERP
jgi:uncharacterized protein (TIGR02588 family)